MVLARFAVVAAALAAATSAVPVEQVLAADDVCADGGADCALHALQQQRWEVDGSGATELKASSEHDALFEAMAKAGVREEHLEKPRVELAKLSAKEAMERSNATSNATCNTWTGGTCLTSGCAASRGATDCSSFRCVCKRGFCSMNGVCTFDFREAASAFGAAWGSPPAPSPMLGSWGRPPAPSPMFGWMAPPAPAPAPLFGWMGAPAPSANPWASAWSAPQSGGSRLTGGTCMTRSCDASRGATECGITTGYKCMCQNNFHSVNGVCVWR